MVQGWSIPFGNLLVEGLSVPIEAVNIQATRRRNLELLIEERFGGIATRLAEAVGRQPSYVFRLFSDNPDHARAIGERLARDIENRVGLPAGWLDLPTHGKQKTPAARVGNTAPASEGATRLPLISWVSAGMRDHAHDPYSPGTAEAWVEFGSIASDTAFCLRVRGTSMVRPDGTGFPDGCIIAVEPKRKPRSGDYVVVRFNDSDEATFKQYFVDGPLKLLKPLNPEFPTLQVTPDAALCGVVFEKRIIETY